MIELRAPGGKTALVIEITRARDLNVQGLDTPFQSSQEQAVESRRIARYRVANATAFEERRSLEQRRKDR